MTEPYWLAEPAEPPTALRLEGRPDVAVIGAGVTGSACALALGEGGLRVRVHEARQIASGASGRSGGFALRGAAMPYDDARKRLGADKAASLWLLTERYLDRLEVLAGDALRRCGSLRLADGKEEREKLWAEYAALREDGFAVEWVERLEPPLDELFRGGIRHPCDGALRPARSRPEPRSSKRAGSNRSTHSTRTRS